MSGKGKNPPRSQGYSSKANNNLLVRMNENLLSEHPSEYDSMQQFGSTIPVFNKEHSCWQDGEEEVIIEGDYVQEKGFGWIVAGLIIVGELAGGGIVALPTAMIQTQFYPGVILTVFMSFVLSFTAYCLGKSWAILLRLFPKYRSHCRKPYPEIGYRALGPIMKTIVTIFVNTTLFGICTVFLLLAAKNIQDFLSAFFDIHISYCILILIVAAFLLPVTFLKSPADFWGAIIVAMLTTVIAVIFVVIGSVLDYKTCHQHMTLPDFNPENYFLAFATIVFAYGGHSAFPTVQHDMKKPSEFSKSTTMAFIIVLCLYAPCCILGPMTYGDSLRSSIINSIQITWIQQVINIAITLHIVLTVILMFNPLNQTVEEIFKVPHHFGIKRVIVRCSMMCAVVFVAESVPQFGPLLDLVGGSLMAFTAIIFPCLFYLFLSTKEIMIKETRMKVTDRKFVPKISDVVRYTPKVMLIACIVTIMIALVGASAATYSAIKGLAGTHFQAPCYVLSFIGDSGHGAAPENRGAHSVHTNLNCCGHYQNISRFSDLSLCSEPELNFYN